jgi:hypothetical protein
MGVMTGVPSGALGLPDTGGAGGGFPATTAALHSSIVGGAGFLMTDSAIALTILLLLLLLRRSTAFPFQKCARDFLVLKKKKKAYRSKIHLSLSTLNLMAYE